MSERVNDRDVFSLREVALSIKKTISARYKSSYWIKAEMNKLNYYTHSGHCYPDLVEKSDGKVIAQIRANLWRDDYARINRKFITTLKEPLKDGVKILFCARISFDPVYGLSLQITDIDPSYTLGDLEKEKQETIRRLKEEDVFDKNKKLPIAVLPQRIAIISIETSKGYSDFLNVLNSNTWGYAFFHLLFPSLLQGEKAVDGIINQLQRFKKVITHFDAVAIIRGGGGDVGLSCYNNYRLAREIALYPLPVFTGIGHSTNETVAEMISFYNAITPTKLAEYFIQKFHNFSVPVNNGQKSIVDKSKRILKERRERFQSEVKFFRSQTRNVLVSNSRDIRVASESLLSYSKYLLRNRQEKLKIAQDELRTEAITLCNANKRFIYQHSGSLVKDSKSIISSSGVALKQSIRMIDSNCKHLLLSHSKHQFVFKEKLRYSFQTILKNNKVELNSAEKNIENMSPSNVLRRGYSIALANGKAIRSYREVADGDTVKTILFEGSIESSIVSIKKLE